MQKPHHGVATVSLDTIERSACLQQLQGNPYMCAGIVLHYIKNIVTFFFRYRSSQSHNHSDC